MAVLFLACDGQVLAASIGRDAGKSGLFALCFMAGLAMKQFLHAAKPFPVFGDDTRKRRMVIHLPTTRPTTALPETRQMRTLSFILAFGVLLAGPSLAGSADGSLPGPGSFAFNGLLAPANAPIQLAHH
jgi:hypothetical protein